MEFGPHHTTATRIFQQRRRDRRLHLSLLLLLLCIGVISASKLDLPASFASGMSEFASAVNGSSGSGLGNFVETAFPPAIHTRVLQQYAPSTKSLWEEYFSYTVTESYVRFESTAFDQTETEERLIYVVPLGYIYETAIKIIETLEIAAWGTVLALLIAIPLVPAATRRFAPSLGVRAFVRGFASFNRAVPELISAMLLVLIFGFGALAGIIALGLHSAGFFIKFIADDIENSPSEPYRALSSFGFSNWQVVRWAVVPHVIPQLVAYSQYILERNVRSAAILGIVGAGGIGMELKGRWDLGQFDHVTTIVIAIFICVVAMEYLSNRLRAKIIDEAN